MRAGSLPGERDDGFRVALAIEGGAMRGTISAGMALALGELGLVSAFDAVYGASAGAISGAWLLSRPQGLRGWTEPAYARAFIRRSGPLRGRPVADIRGLMVLSLLPGLRAGLDGGSTMKPGSTTINGRDFRLGCPCEGRGGHILGGRDVNRVRCRASRGTIGGTNDTNTGGQ